jgi:ABC-type branched-subunit amino acid transport system ATPase component
MRSASWRTCRPPALRTGRGRLVELARARAMTPRLLVLDESAAGLTESKLGMLIETIRQTTDFGVGALLIEHNVPTVVTEGDSADLVMDEHIPNIVRGTGTVIGGSQGIG